MRDRILKLAEAQMVAGGYDCLNFAGIAASLDTTRANVHYHFKNKQGLAEAVLDQYVDASFAFMDAVLERNVADFAGYLAEVESFIIDRTRQRGTDPACVCAPLLADQAAPTELTSWARRYFNDKRNRIEALIAASQAAGTITSDVDAAQLSLLTASLLMGIDQMAIASTDDDAFARAVEGMLTDFVERYR